MSKSADWGRRENIRWAIEGDEDLGRFDPDDVAAVAAWIRRRNRYVPRLIVLGLVLCATRAVFTGDWWDSVLLAVVGLAPMFWYLRHQNARAEAVLRRMKDADQAE